MRVLMSNLALIDVSSPEAKVLFMLAAVFLDCRDMVAFLGKFNYVFLIGVSDYYFIFSRARSGFIFTKLLL